MSSVYFYFWQDSHVEEVSKGYAFCTTVCFQFNVGSDCSNSIPFMVYLYMVMIPAVLTINLDW